MRRVTGAPKVSPTRIGVKNAAQASIALSSTGISMTMPRTRSGACDATSSVVLAPSEVPPITAWSSSRWSMSASTSSPNVRIE